MLRKGPCIVAKAFQKVVRGLGSFVGKAKTACNQGEVDEAHEN